MIQDAIRCPFWTKVEGALRSKGYKSVCAACPKLGVPRGSVREWLMHNKEPGIVVAERLALVLNIPLYILIDDEQEMPVDTAWSREEVEASSLRNVGYNMRALCSIRKTSPSVIAIDTGINVRQIERMRYGDDSVRCIETYRVVARYFNISLQDLFSDFTKSAIVHTAFEHMNPCERICFMAALKGVSRRYLCSLSKYPYSMFRRAQYNSPMGMWFASWMCQYFNIPLWWVLDLPRREPWKSLKIPDGMSLRTSWNTIV